MNIQQAVKMAWKSIWGKKGRSALTMLGIIIGIAAVMTIVSAINGYTEKTMEQYEAMGSNKLTVNIWNYLYDEDGNSLGQDYFPALYDYCNSIKEYVLGVTPQAYCNATVVYGTKSTANMSYNYDENGNLTGDVPPSIYYGSDQYSICNNLTLASGRDLSVLDIRGYKQVCVLGDRAAKIFFDAADPVGKVLQLNGQSFEVVGVYAPRLTGESASASQIDNVIILPYTARRVLGGDAPEQFIVKTRSSEDMIEASSRIGGFLKGVVNPNAGGFQVDQENSWQQEQNKQMGMISLILGGIAAISLLVGGIVISALGAVMDVTMGIASSLSEVHAANPELSRRELFRSGMNIGRDMVGTMTNTLILAFLGSGFTLILYLYSLGLSPRQLLSSAYVSLEVVSGVASSVGVILSIPLTALITAEVFTREKKSGKSA